MPCLDISTPRELAWLGHSRGGLASSASRGLDPREGLGCFPGEDGSYGLQAQSCRGPQAGKSGDPCSQDTDKLKVAINLEHHQRELDNAKAEASLAASREACSRALEEAREADRRCEAAEKRAWELQAWSASLERQVEAHRAALASLRGTPAEEEEIRRREEALALEAVERSFELER